MKVYLLTLIFVNVNLCIFLRDQFFREYLGISLSSLNLVFITLRLRLRLFMMLLKYTATTSQSYLWHYESWISWGRDFHVIQKPWWGGIMSRNIFRFRFWAHLKYSPLIISTQPHSHVTFALGLLVRYIAVFFQCVSSRENLVITMRFTVFWDSW